MKVKVYCQDYNNELAGQCKSFNSDRKQCQECKQQGIIEVELAREGRLDLHYKTIDKIANAREFQQGLDYKHFVEDLEEIAKSYPGAMAMIAVIDNRIKKYKGKNEPTG